MNSLEKTIHYEFKDPALLRLALTHPSVGRENNQRLEFLGDAVLELHVSKLLYALHPDWGEGRLTATRAAMVCERALARQAREWGLGACLRMNQGEEATGGRDKDSVLCDAVEALIAAVYLDGGETALPGMIQGLLREEQVPAEIRGSYRGILCSDYKGMLQSEAQSRKMPLPEYTIIHREGTDNAPLYTARVKLENGITAEGTGSSKKQAEQEAAHAALAQWVQK